MIETPNEARVVAFAPQVVPFETTVIHFIFLRHVAMEEFKCSVRIRRFPALTRDEHV